MKQDVDLFMLEMWQKLWQEWSKMIELWEKLLNYTGRFSFCLNFRPREYHYKDLVRLFLEISGSGVDSRPMPKAIYK